MLKVIFFVKSISRKCFTKLRIFFCEITGNLDGGLYVGPSGIAYALWKLSTFLESSPTDSKPILEYAQHLMKLNLQYTQKPERQRDKKNKFGFLLGIVDILTRKDIFFLKILFSNFFRRIWSTCSCSSYISFRREPSRPRPKFGNILCNCIKKWIDTNCGPSVWQWWTFVS